MPSWKSTPRRKAPCCSSDANPQLRSDLRGALEKLDDGYSMILSACEAIEATGQHAHHCVVIRNGLQLLTFAYTALDAAIGGGS